MFLTGFIVFLLYPSSRKYVLKANWKVLQFQHSFPEFIDEEDEDEVFINNSNQKGIKIITITIMFMLCILLGPFCHDVVS